MVNDEELTRLMLRDEELTPEEFLDFIAKLVQRGVAWGLGYGDVVKELLANGIINEKGKIIMVPIEEEIEEIEE